MGKNLEEIKKAGNRAAALTQQLLAFSRRQVMKPKVIDLNRLIANWKSSSAGLSARTSRLKPSVWRGWGASSPTRADRAGDHESLHQRARRHAARRTDHRGNIECGHGIHPSGDPIRDHAGRLRAAAHPGQRERHGRETAPPVEPFFTTKEVGKAPAWGFNRIRDRQTDRRLYRRGKRAGQRHFVDIYFPRSEAGAKPSRLPVSRTMCVAATNRYSSSRTRR